MKCEYCGRTLTNKYKFCPECGAAVTEEKTDSLDKTEEKSVEAVVETVVKKNEDTPPVVKKMQGFTIAGFVLSLVSIVLQSTPDLVSFICATLGLVFSAISLSKFNPKLNKGKGLAIAGLVISIVVLSILFLSFVFSWSFYPFPIA